MKIYEAIQEQREVHCQKECLQRGYHHKCYFPDGENENCKDYKPIPRKEESDILKIRN